MLDTYVLKSNFFQETDYFDYLRLCGLKLPKNSLRMQHLKTPHNQNALSYRNEIILTFCKVNNDFKVKIKAQFGSLSGQRK